MAKTLSQTQIKFSNNSSGQNSIPTKQYQQQLLLSSQSQAIIKPLTMQQHMQQASVHQIINGPGPGQIATFHPMVKQKKKQQSLGGVTGINVYR
jgi:hypothetical protein